MPLVLGLDQSITQTGFAFYAGGDERRIECGSFSAAAPGEAEGQCDLFAYELKRLIGPRRKQLTFICWERASRRIAAFEKRPPKQLKRLGLIRKDDPPVFTVNAGQLLLPEIQGVIRAFAVAYRIPYESVDVHTWRAALFGKGGGALPKQKAKGAARDYCKWLGIKAANHNEAEAACVAIWAARCSQRLKFLRIGEDAA